MTDMFHNIIESLISPARSCFAITPHDSKTLRTGGSGSGTITLQTVDIDADVAHSVNDGERIDVRATHVRLTGTTVKMIGYA